MEIEKKEETAVPSNEPSTVERAEDAAKRLEDANIKAEELLRKNEEIVSKQILAGRAEAGKPAEEKKEETPKEYKDRIMQGTPTV